MKEKILLGAKLRKFKCPFCGQVHELNKWWAKKFFNYTKEEPLELYCSNLKYRCDAPYIKIYTTKLFNSKPPEAKIELINYICSFKEAHIEFSFSEDDCDMEKGILAIKREFKFKPCYFKSCRDCSGFESHSYGDHINVKLDMDFYFDTDDLEKAIKEYEEYEEFKNRTLNNNRFIENEFFKL